MTKENKRMLDYINYQMKAGITFDMLCKNFGYEKKQEETYYVFYQPRDGYWIENHRLFDEYGEFVPKFEGTKSDCEKWIEGHTR